MLACDYLRIINFLDGEFIMSETIKVQLEETVENKLRALNGYLEYIQKMSFISMDLTRRNIAHWQDFVEHSVANEGKVLVNSYELAEKIKKEIQASCEDNTKALKDLTIAQTYLKQRQNSKTKDSLVEIEEFYAQSLSYWQDKLAVFNLRYPKE